MKNLQKCVVLFLVRNLSQFKLGSLYFTGSKHDPFLSNFCQKVVKMIKHQFITFLVLFKTRCYLCNLINDFFEKSEKE